MCGVKNALQTTAALTAQDKKNSENLGDQFPTKWGTLKVGEKTHKTNDLADHQLIVGSGTRVHGNSWEWINRSQFFQQP